MSNKAPLPGRGTLFVVSAPSGAGKTSLCKRIVDIFSNLRQSVSFTTRPMRPGEREGVDYFFVSSDTFADMVSQGAFAEWAEVHGNRYGTAIKTLEHWRDAGLNMLLDIDTQGAEQLRQSYADAVFIFILPPDFTELRRRLEGRGTEAADVIERRIRNARDEIRQAIRYDYIIVNDDFESAVEQLKAIIVAEPCRTSRMRPEVATRFEMDL